MTYELSNQRRSAHSVIRNYSVAEIEIIAEIGDYIDQRLQMGATREEALNHLKENSHYKSFLEGPGKKLTVPQALATHKMQQGLLDGMTPVNREIRKGYSKEQEAKALRSLNRQSEKEQRPLLDGGLEEDLKRQLE